MNFIYDEETRKHTLDGKPIPSVTQIIKPLYDFSNIPDGVLERKGELGRQFHKAVELYIKDDLDEESVDENLLLPLRTFKEWYVDTKLVYNEGVIMLEEAAYHEKQKYCGKPDIVTMKKDVATIYDVKLRKCIVQLDVLQLVAYKRMLEKTLKEKYKAEKIHLKVLSFDMAGRLTTYNFKKNLQQDVWYMFLYLKEEYWRQREKEEKIKYYLERYII